MLYVRMYSSLQPLASSLTLRYTFIMLYLACLSYVLTFSLGMSVQYAHVRLGRWRKLHHVLFFNAWLMTLVALGWGWWRGHAQWWLPALVLPVLALFPTRRASTVAHRWLGLIGLVVWLVILAVRLA